MVLSRHAGLLTETWNSKYANFILGNVACGITLQKVGFPPTLRKANDHQISFHNLPGTLISTTFGTYIQTRRRRFMWISRCYTRHGACLAGSMHKASVWDTIINIQSQFFRGEMPNWLIHYSDLLEFVIPRDLLATSIYPSETNCESGFLLDLHALLVAIVHLPKRCPQFWILPESTSSHPISHLPQAFDRGRPPRLLVRTYGPATPWTELTILSFEIWARLLPCETYHYLKSSIYLSTTILSLMNFHLSFTKKQKSKHELFLCWLGFRKLSSNLSPF